jgi:hypothetical protein
LIIVNVILNIPITLSVGRNAREQDFRKDMSMRTLLRSSALVVLLAGPLMLGGCATQDAVEHAQSTADEALSAAQHAQATADAASQKADTATQSADSASQKADAAAADAKRANDRLDSMRKRKGQRG